MSQEVIILEMVEDEIVVEVEHVNNGPLVNDDTAETVPFTSEILLTNPMGDYTTATAGNKVFTKSDGTHLAFAWQVIRVPASAGRTISFSTDFIELNNALDSYDANKDCMIWMYYNPITNKIDYNITSNTAADVTPPTLSAFAIATATPNRVTFESSEAITGTTFAGFTISGKTISSININTGQTTGHYFVVSANFVEGGSHTIAYNGADDWEDTDSNALASFTATAITNNIDDPDLSTATVEDGAADDIVLTYERALDETSTPATTDFSVSGGKSVSAVVVSGSTVTVTVNSDYENGDTITISYTPGTNKIKDTYGNPADALVSQAVTNNISAASFSPNDLTPDYYLEAEQTFTGSNYVDSGIYNAPFREDYWHIWFKVAPTDGQPATVETVFGGYTSTTSTRLRFGIQTTGALNILHNTANDNTTNIIWANGANAYKTIHIHRTPSALNVYVDGVFLEAIATNTNPTTNSTRAMAYGALNNNGTIGNYLNGTVKGMFVKGGSSDLTAQNISDMDSYMSSL